MILAHDTKAKSTTVDALPKIIEYYKSKKNIPFYNYETMYVRQ
mgnify:CR=1 FL=1